MADVVEARMILVREGLGKHKLYGLTGAADVDLSQAGAALT